MTKKYLKYLQEAIVHLKKSSKLGLKGKKTLCIDFDGVIHAYSKGYHDGTIYDKPMEGVQQALDILSKKYDLVCFSARINAGDAHGKKDMVEWLKNYDLLKYFIDITDKKIPCVAYIDDSAIRHTDWKSTFNELRRLEII